MGHGQLISAIMTRTNFSQADFLPVINRNIQVNITAPTTATIIV